MKRFLKTVPAVLLMLACGGGDSADRGVIQNKGSDTLVNVAQAWAEEYGVVNPNVAVAVSGGGSGTGISAMINGTVDIAKIDGGNKTVIVSLGKGEFFGEMAVIDGSARSATAIASAPATRVMRINHARFVYLVSQQPAFALMVMDALSKRLRASNAVTYRAAAAHE